MITKLDGDAKIRKNAVVVPQNTSSKLYLESQNLNITVKPNSKLVLLDNKLDSKSEHKIVVYLEQGAELKYFGFFFGSSKQNFGSNLEVNHTAPRTRSSIVTRGVLDDKSQASNNAIVKINSNAFKSVTNQKDDVLLLSEDAKVESAPQLEISEEEVTASHGAAIGRLNRDKMFYLMSRGLTEKEARRQIVSAFFEPMFNELEDETLVQGAKCIIASRLK